MPRGADRSAGGIVASLPGVSLWAWLQGGMVAALLTAALGALLLAARRRWTPARVAGLWTLCAGYWLSRFYVFGPDGLPRSESITEIPWGPALLTLLTLIAGVGLTGLLIAPTRALVVRAAGRLAPLLDASLYVAGLCLAGFFALDLYFADREATAFRYATARYHPFLTYHLPGAYPYNHAQERFVHDTRGLRFEQAKPPGTVRVVLSGASTMWGHFQRDDESPARALAAALRHRDPMRRYEVLTVAVQGKYQLNELIDAVVTLPHWNPDLVIGLNGINELLYGEEDGYYEGMPSMGPQIEAALEMPPLVSLFYSRTHLGATLLPNRLREPPRYALNEPKRYESPRYYAYLRQTAETLLEAGIPYAYSFCPSVLEKRQLRGAEHEAVVGGERLVPLVRRRRALASRIVDEAGQLSFDIMEGLDRDEELFGDICHFNSAGVARLAEYLAGRVPDWLARRPLRSRAPRPEEFPPLDDTGRIRPGRADSDEYLGAGWSVPEGSFRWTDGPSATLRFAADPKATAILRLHAGAFVAERLTRQRVVVTLNGRRLAAFEAAQPATLEWALPPGALQERNVVAFELPDAASPRSLGVSADARRLGLALEWLELEPAARASRP